jgi:hypothetical protein
MGMEAGRDGGDKRTNGCVKHRSDSSMVIATLGRRIHLLSIATRRAARAGIKDDSPLQHGRPIAQTRVLSAECSRLSNTL